jgi:hypothetical protein
VSNDAEQKVAKVNRFHSCSHCLGVPARVLSKSRPNNQREPQPGRRYYPRSEDRRVAGRNEGGRPTSQQDRKSAGGPAYDQYDYVTSDLNPGTVFIGKQLEFNSNTKYFYRDRSIPKKKLTEAEMVEINRLYRIIGRCEGEIAKLTEPPAPAAGSEDNAAGSAPEKRPRLLNPYTGGALLLLAVIILFLLSRRRSG